MNRITRFVAAVLYFGLARYLPGSSAPLSLGLSRPFRALLCRQMFTRCGKNVNIERGAYFGLNIEIGDNSGIGTNARLVTTGGITIGRNVMMGPDVMIFTQDHEHCDVLRPMAEQGYHVAHVAIEDDVWIGARVIILAGVRIGRSSVIGAGSVVTRDVPSFSVIAGNPAVVRKRRDADLSATQ